MNLKLSKKLLIFINFTYLNFLIILFIIPILFYGTVDQEEYQLGIFSLKFQFQNFNNLFLNYIDFYGAGINFPIGNMPLIHPANFFVNNIKLFYFIFIYINLLLFSYFFFKAIKLLFKDDGKTLLLILPIVIFSIPNFNYIYSDDWPNAFFIYNFYFCIFYYAIKFCKKEKPNDFYKLIFTSAFLIAMGGIGMMLIFLIFILLLILINKKINVFKKKIFLIGFVFFSLITFHYLYFTFSEFLKFDSSTNKVVQNGYDITDYIFSIFSPFINTLPFNRGPGYGLLIFITIFYSFNNIIKSKKLIFGLEYLLIIFFAISLMNKNFFSYFISAIWFARDIIFLISIVLIYKILKDKVLPKTIVILILCHPFLYYYSNLNLLEKNQTDNVIKNYNKNSELINFLKKNIKNNNNLNRLYLSPDINSDFRYTFKNLGLYGVTDFTDYNLHPFNGWFKNISTDKLYKPNSMMHGYIGSNYDLINNDYFFSLFKIKNLMIYRSELKHVDLNKFQIKKVFKNQDKEILFLEINEFKSFEVLDLPSESINCILNLRIYCLLNSKNLETVNFEIKRKTLNNFDIKNYENKEIKILFPFYEAKNWNFYLGKKKLSVENFENFPIITIPKLSVLEAKYQNYNILFVSKIISLISIILFLIFIILLSFKKNE
jgi:hypothetical protein